MHQILKMTLKEMYYQNRFKFENNKVLSHRAVIINNK